MWTKTYVIIIINISRSTVVDHYHQYCFFLNNENMALWHLTMSKLKLVLLNCKKWDSLVCNWATVSRGSPSPNTEIFVLTFIAQTVLTYARDIQLWGKYTVCPVQTGVSNLFCVECPTPIHLCTVNCGDPSGHGYLWGTRYLVTALRFHVKHFIWKLSCPRISYELKWAPVNEFSINRWDIFVIFILLDVL